MPQRNVGNGPLHRTGYTLIELAVVVAILSVVTLAGIRRLQWYLDGIAVRTAVREIGALVARARDEAMARRAVVSLHIDTATSSISLRPRGGPTQLHPVGRTYGVALSTTRDSIVFDVRGLGYGAANLTLVARRGAASDTLVVSRLGRVRE
ncbi:MAG TPA: GspH/FimT family pseudopilin [Gemmatimonadaceae bacterium]|jgi:prepilin-type N-terminal cleavage/methylation domain-containing protein